MQGVFIKKLKIFYFLRVNRYDAIISAIATTTNRAPIFSLESCQMEVLLTLIVQTTPDHTHWREITTRSLHEIYC